MKFKVEPIDPGEVFNATEISREVNQGLDTAAEGVRDDFNKTTASWNNKPGFDIEGSGTNAREIFTTNKVYGIQNAGSPPHIITGSPLAFPANHRSKRMVGVIGSRPGGSFGPTVFATIVRHPGFVGGAWDKVISKKWERLLPVEVQKAIDKAVT